MALIIRYGVCNPYRNTRLQSMDNSPAGCCRAVGTYALTLVSAQIVPIPGKTFLSPAFASLSPGRAAVAVFNRRSHVSRPFAPHEAPSASMNRRQRRIRTLQVFYSVPARGMQAERTDLAA